MFSAHLWFILPSMGNKQSREKKKKKRTSGKSVYLMQKSRSRNRGTRPIFNSLFIIYYFILSIFKWVAHFASEAAVRGWFWMYSGLMCISSGCRRRHAYKPSAAVSISKNMFDTILFGFKYLLLAYLAVPTQSVFDKRTWAWERFRKYFGLSWTNRRILGNFQLWQKVNAQASDASSKSSSGWVYIIEIIRNDPNKFVEISSPCLRVILTNRQHKRLTLGEKMYCYWIVRRINLLLRIQWKASDDDRG